MEPHKISSELDSLIHSAALRVVMAALGCALLSIGCNKPAGSQQAKGDAAPNVLVTFVELGSVNCIPCRMMQPLMREIENRYPGQVNVVFHDVWTEEGKPYGEKYNIRVIPTQVFLDSNGVEYYRHEGFFPKDQLIAVLEKKGVK